MEEKQPLFRKQAMDRITSPDKLTEYLKVTGPGMWVMLATVVLLLAGVITFACIGTLDTTESVKVVVSDSSATVVMIDNSRVEAGMLLEVAQTQTTILRTDNDEYGRNIGYATLALPDGTYDGTLIVERIHPISFLFENETIEQ